MQFFKFIRCLVNCLTEPAGQGCSYCETEEKASEQTLLTEYGVCQDHNNSLSTVHWASASIFVGFTLTLLGGLAVAILDQDPPADAKGRILAFVLILVLSLGVIVIIKLMECWLDRTNCLIESNRERMLKIEERLGMKKIHMQNALTSSVTGRRIMGYVYSVIVTLWIVLIIIAFLVLFPLN